MKMKFWTMVAAMISTSLMADQASTPAAVTTTLEAVSTNAPAASAAPTAQPAKTTPRPARRTAPTQLRSVALNPGPAIVAANRVNVRGQGKLKSEVLGRMTNGEPVTVIEEVQLKNSGPDEPSAWAKIVLPEKIHPWVHSKFIDKSTKAVIPKKLNLRGGPGENYSILGTLQQGDTVKEIQAKGDWIEIESPSGAYAFMAAQYLSQDPTAMAAAHPAAVTEAPMIASTTTEVPVENMVNTNASEVATAVTNEMASTTTEIPAVEEPLPPRIVQREGLVRYTVSIQAPTMFQLISPDNGRPINYLYTASPNLDLNRYKGLRIIVTGEEGLDERWRNTPIITIHKIQVLD